MKPGEVLQVIAGHEPVHLLQHMAHEGLPVDAGAYYSHPNSEGTYSGFFTRIESSGENSRIKVTSFDQERNFSEKQFNRSQIVVQCYAPPLFGTYAISVGPAAGITGLFLAYRYSSITDGKEVTALTGDGSPHRSSTDLVFTVFRGTGTGIFGDREEHLLPGSVVVIPGEEKRGIKAIADIEGLHIVSPIPDESDHVEVLEKLSGGRFL